MALRKKTGAALAVLMLAASAAVMSPAPASAQWIVYDPNNFGQNVLTAARSLQQINNQIKALQNQAQMILNQGQSLINQAKNLEGLAWSPIVGIGTGLFSQFQSAAGTDPNITEALSIVLGAIALLGLGIFGPGIATGLVSGAPQLGAGAAVGATAAGAGLIAAGGMGALAAGRLAGGAALGGAKAASSMASGVRTAYGEAAAASGASGMARSRAGMAGVARAGASAASDAVRSSAGRMWRGGAAGTGGGAGSAAGADAAESQSKPAWARNMRRRQGVRRGLETAGHAVRSGDHGGAGAAPDLGEEP